GLMVRESLDAGARNAFLFVTPAGTLRYQWRQGANDTTENPDLLHKAALKLPSLPRPTRHGGTIIAQHSTGNRRGHQAAREPRSFAPALPKTLYVGLAVTAHDASKITEARFRGLEVRKP